MAPDFEAWCKTKNKNLEIKEVFHTSTLFNQVKSILSFCKAWKMFV
jgi:hypothetical protein